MRTARASFTVTPAASSSARLHRPLPHTARLNTVIRRHSGRCCRRGESRRILPDELLEAQRPLPR
jgi:hypothetical protein